MLSENEAAEHLSARGVPFSAIRPIGEAVHIFTHLEWHMTGYLVTLNAPIEGLAFATKEELSAVYALPSAFRYFKRYIEENER